MVSVDFEVDTKVWELTHGLGFEQSRGFRVKLWTLVMTLTFEESLVNYV